jgi:hypothetical protein
MAKIVNHRHAARDAFDFHAAFNSFERVERALDLFVRQPAMFRRADDGERVANVQFANQIQMKLEAGNFKRRRRRAEVQVETLHGIFRAEAETLHRAMRNVQQRREIGVVAVAEQQTVARHEADEM